MAGSKPPAATPPVGGLNIEAKGIIPCAGVGEFGEVGLVELVGLPGVPGAGKLPPPPPPPAVDPPPPCIRVDIWSIMRRDSGFDLYIKVRNQNGQSIDQQGGGGRVGVITHISSRNLSLWKTSLTCGPIAAS